MATTTTIQGVDMNFPFTEINNILRNADDKFNYINYGGCGVMAYILARQFSKVTQTRIVSNCGRANAINIVRKEIANNTMVIDDLYNIFINHAWVEFKVNGRWYGVDSDGIRKMKDMHIVNGKPAAGGFSIKEMHLININKIGWNPQFDRGQIPGMKRMINRKLNKIFGAKLNQISVKV